MEFYCVKCKSKKEITEFEKVTLKNGRPAVKSVCPDCGTKVFRIVKKEENGEEENEG